MATIGNVEVEKDGAHVGSEELPLSPNELKLLQRLAQQPGALVHELDLSMAVYGPAPPTSNTLQVTVSRLRKKLSAAGAKVTVKNIRGRGYVLREADAE